MPEPMPEQSLASVDVMLLRFDRSDRRIELAVGTRRWEPFAGELALPGVLLLRGERLSEAATRAITTKLGVDADDIAAVGQLATYDEPNRDPRGPTLSLTLWAVAPTGTEVGPQARWVDLTEPPPLAFDHDRIVAESRPLLNQLLWRDRGFSETLTGSTFPVADAIAIGTALAGQAPDRGNLNRLLKSTPGLRRTEDVQQVHGVGRPSSMWAWE